MNSMFKILLLCITYLLNLPANDRTSTAYCADSSSTDIRRSKNEDTRKLQTLSFDSQRDQQMLDDLIERWEINTAMLGKAYLARHKDLISFNQVKLNLCQQIKLSLDQKIRFNEDEKAEIEALCPVVAKNFEWETKYHVNSPSIFLSSSWEFKLFLNKLKNTIYNDEPLNNVLDFFIEADYLMVPDKKIEDYARSIVEQNPLVLYQAYKELAISNYQIATILAGILKTTIPFKMQQRIGDINNPNLTFGTSSPIYHVAMIDRDTLITVSHDRTAVIWCKNTQGIWEIEQQLGEIGNINPALGHTGIINTVTLIDHQTIATASHDRTIIIWHKNMHGKWQLSQRIGALNNTDAAISHTSFITSIAMIDINTIITASDDKTAIIWRRNIQGMWQFDQRLGEIANTNHARGHTEQITSIAILDQNTIATGSFDHSVIIWGKNQDGTWQLQRHLGASTNPDPALGHTGAITSIAVLDRNTIVTGSHDRTIIIWHKNTHDRWQIQERLGLKNTNQLHDHVFEITSVAVLDANSIVTGHMNRIATLWQKNQDGKWQLQQQLGQNANTNPARGHVLWLTSIAAIDEDTLASASADGTIIFWHRDNIEKHFEPTSQQIGDCCIC